MNEFRPKIRAKRWDRSWEKYLIDDWERRGLYKFDIKRSKGEIYSIDTPPPYINSPIHIGHAYTYTWMDAIARYKRMKGYDVLFPLGLDRNGLPIEVQVEREYEIDIKGTSREGFLRECRKLLDGYERSTVEYFKRLGISFNNWKKEYTPGGLYETDDPEYRRLTQETFIELYKKGLIYEGKKTVNYCPRCGTTISDAEIEYETFETELVYLRFGLVDGDDEIIVATTRPELLGACKAVIFNPGDERYAILNGKRAIVPIYDVAIPILPHPYAKPDFGTGLVMVCSYGDSSDIQLFRELGLQPTYLIDVSGHMTREAGPYAGLKVEEARERIIDDLSEMGLVERVERIKHRRPVCWRCKTPIEFVASDEIFVKQVEFKEKLMKYVEKMNFYSPKSKQILLDWIKSIKEDWPVSRRRYYGTEIPIWYCRKCGERILPPPGRYYRPWKEPPPIERCPRCGSKEFVGETRIFDTWFDSSSSAQYIVGYLWDKGPFEKNYPISLRPQGKEIVRNWLYFTLLKSVLLWEKPPFKDVWIHMHVVDEQGRKMAKSLGNVIDPKDVMDRYGSEPFRAWTFLEGNITEGDIRCSYRRIEAHSRYLTKLWNIARFISAFPYHEGCDQLTPTEEWILAELGEIIKKVNELNDNYDFYGSMNEIRRFTWDIFADHYIELVKERAYGRGFPPEEQRAAWWGLHMVLKALLILQAPMLPFITDAIWRQVYDSTTSVHEQKYLEKIYYNAEYLRYTRDLIEFNSMVWTEKKRRNMKFNEPIEITVPPMLLPFKKDLMALHKLIP